MLLNKYLPPFVGARSYQPEKKKRIKRWLEKYRYTRERDSVLRYINNIFSIKGKQSIFQIFTFFTMDGVSIISDQDY